MSENTKFANQSILGRPPSSFRSKLYSVTPLPKSKVFPKYVNGMKSKKKNQSANVSKRENQKKHKENVKKSKTLSSEDRLASSRPSKPRTCLKWLPTDTLIDSSNGFMDLHGNNQRPTNCCLSKRYKAVKVFQVLCKQGDWFSFSKRRNTEDICTDDGPSNMKLWKNKFFLIDRKAIPNYLTWKSTQSCVSVDFPTDGYVTQLCAHLTRLRKVNEAVLVRSGLSSAWFNLKCNSFFRMKDDSSEMSIYDFMTLPSWENVKGIPIPLPTSKEVVVGQPDLKLAKKVKALLKQKVYISLVGPFKDVQPKRKRRLRRKASEARSSAPATEQAEDVDGVDFLRVIIVPSLKVALRGTKVTLLEPFLPLTYELVRGVARPHRLSQVDFSDPSHVGTSNVTNASSFDHADVQKEPDDEFSNATLGEEIDLTLFPLAPGPYYMSYPFTDGEGSDPPKYIREEWDGPHASEANILSKEIYKVPDVCKRALDRTISHANLERTESLLLLQLSNRISVISALLASHGMEMNSCYTALVVSHVLY
nr:hypothetical protein [Tanacetum cinerariifolium]